MNYTPLDLKPHSGVFTKVISGGIIVASFVMVGLSIYLNLPANSSSRAALDDPSLVNVGQVPSAGNGVPESELLCPANFEKITENQSCATELKILTSTTSTVRCCAVASSLPPRCPDGSKTLTQEDLRALVNVASQCPGPVPATNPDGSASSSLFCCPKLPPSQCVEPDYQFVDTIKCLECEK